MSHLKTFTEFRSRDFTLNCNKSINLFDLILIHSSSWPAIAEPVTKINFYILFRIDVNLIEPFPYYAYTKYSLSVNVY